MQSRHKVRISQWLRYVTAMGLAAMGGLACASNERVHQLEITDVSGYWAVRGEMGEHHYIYPVVRFRVANDGAEPVDYVQAMAVYRQESEPEMIWTSVYQYSIAGQPLEPGESSPLVSLPADTHYYSEDEPEQMLTSDEWDPVTAEIFLRVGGNPWQRLETVEIEDRIGAPGVDQFIEPSAPPEEQTPEM